MGALKKILLHLYDYYWKFFDLIFEDDDYDDEGEDYWDD